jgi:2-dehydro-3-deoxygalactonokinase
MSGAAYVAGDWGTSNLRLYLCASDGRVLERRTGQGVAALRAAGSPDWTGVIKGATAGWDERLPVLLCGMVGADIGWQRVPYLPCPVDTAALAQACVPVPGTRVRIVPGLSCTNLHGAYDVMRGEETQVAGALRLEPRLRAGRHLLCLPGTHAKWAWLDAGSVTGFVTGASGELYALIQQHSVLVRAAAARPTDAGFAAALLQLDRHPQAAFAQLAFECRARQLAGEFDADTAAGYLSGLLVGSEVRAVLAEGGRPGEPVVLVGEAALCAAYGTALRHHSVPSHLLAGDDCVQAGLHAFIREELPRENP